TSLPAVLTGTASDLDVARSLLAICAVLLFLLAAAALLAVARLLTGQREGEAAMLTARGATRRQLVGLAAAEAIPLCLLAAAAGGVLGVLLARLFAGSGAAVLALRLLPAGGRAGDRLAARGRRLTAALASWQISRQPIRQGGAALLIVLAVATGTLALSQRQSWTRSDHDQAAFSAGADVRADTSQPLSAAQAAGVARLPGVRHAMPVATIPQTATNSQLLALNSGQAADVALVRADQSPVTAAALFGKIARTGPPPGVALPGRAARVQLTARLGPASLGLAPATVNVSVQDAAH